MAMARYMWVMTYVLLLFVNMANLEPNILLGQGTRRVIDNVFEALTMSVNKSRNSLYG